MHDGSSAEVGCSTGVVESSKSAVMTVGVASSGSVVRGKSVGRSHDDPGSRDTGDDVASSRENCHVGASRSVVPKIGRDEGMSGVQERHRSMYYARIYERMARAAASKEGD